MALKDITLGQYFPGHSLVHRLDPRTKILAVVIYIVALFLAKSFVTYAIMFALLALSVKVSTVPVKSLVRGMKPVVFILIFTAVLNLFYTPGEHVLFQVWILTVTLEGVQSAFFMVIRILMLIAGTFLLTYTTSPILLTDGLALEKDQGAGARAGHDDVHCPAVHPHPYRGDGQDHVRPAGPGGRL